MRLKWVLVLALIGFQATVTKTTALEEENAVTGDVRSSLQSFIDIGKVGMGVVNSINIIANQSMDNLIPKTKPQHSRSRRQDFDSLKIYSSALKDSTSASYKTLTSRKMLGRFEVLSNRLDQIEDGVNGVANSLRVLGAGMQNKLRWEIALDTMEEYVRPIGTFYKKFCIYEKMKDRIEDITLVDFASSVVSHDSSSVMSSMAHLHSMAAPGASEKIHLLEETLSISAMNDPKIFNNVNEKVPRKMRSKEKLLKKYTHAINGPEQISLRPSLFRILHNTLKTSDKCHLHQSPQQLMEGLHIILGLTEARGYLMLAFAWMILKICSEGNFTVEQEVSRKLYLQYSEDIMNEANSVLKKMSREFYRCDPQHHREGETYVQLTELLQGYIENEVDMSPTGSCKKNCGYYKRARSEGCYMPHSQYCGKHRRCKGNIYDCQYYDAYATVCISNKVYRRYDSIAYRYNRLGDQQTCRSRTMKVDSWWRFFYHCSYCVCLCDDASSPSSDRYVSLFPVLSDLHNGMIVTGVKFTKQKKVIHLQIQQGQALPQGQIDSSTIQWVNTEPIHVKSSAYREGKDFKRLSFEERGIDLDRLEGPKDHVITGVRFRMLGSRLNLEVKITPIEYTSGVMNVGGSYWISNGNIYRHEHTLHAPDDPTKFKASSKINSLPNTFMRFVPTDMKKDAAQLTVPFFDSQTVAPTPGSWLSGIELFHRGQSGSGGFLAMKVFTYDMTPYMEVTSNV